MDQEISQEDIQRPRLYLQPRTCVKARGSLNRRVRLDEAAKQYVETYARDGGEAGTALIIDERELEQLQ